MTAREEGHPMENKTHKGNYKGTTHMKAENQDMAYVNDTLERTKSVAPVPTIKKETD
jgi:hypothetical protein